MTGWLLILELTGSHSEAAFNILEREAKNRTSGHTCMLVGQDVEAPQRRIDGST
jgi:hypothetical protein